MRYRDEHGRFRKPTDEERFPDPVERGHVQRVRSLFNNPNIVRGFATAIQSSMDAMRFVSGELHDPDAWLTFDTERQ